MNTGLGSTTNQPGPNSGFGNTGTNISGFFNSATGGAASNGNISGVGNTASGGSFADGLLSGFFNHAVTSALSPTNAVTVSGLLNTGNTVAGLFSIVPLLKQLAG